MSASSKRLPWVFSTRNMWPAPLGVILVFASQSVKSGDFWTTSDARSRALLAFLGMSEVFMRGDGQGRMR